MTNISRWRELKTRIDLATQITLTTHMNPDGDALGSERALLLLLKKLNKRVRAINISPVPDNYSFLNEDNLLEHYSENDHDFFLQHSDLGIMLDIGDFERSRKVGDLLRKGSASIVSIDHHPATDNARLTMEIIDTTACSAGTMIYQFMQELFPVMIDTDIATALYVAIMTDTGNFRFSNTTPYTHRIAAGLLEFGLNPYDIYKTVYEQFSVARMKLLGKVLNDLHFEAGGRIVWFEIPEVLVQNVEGDSEDTDGFSDFMRSIQGVEVSIMFKERSDGTCRLNFRSKGRVTMNQVAKQFGGGGHPYACGAIVKRAMKDTIPDVLSAAEKALYEQIG